MRGKEIHLQKIFVLCRFRSGGETRYFKEEEEIFSQSMDFTNIQYYFFFFYVSFG